MRFLDVKEVVGMKNDLIDNFLDSLRSRGSSEAMIRSYESRLRRFDQFLKAKPLEEAARKDAERYLNWMEGEGRAWRTISSYLSTIKIFFR